MQFTASLRIEAAANTTTPIGIDERDDVEGGDKTGDLAYEAEVFECFHGDQGAVSTPARGRIALVGFKRPLTPTGDAFGRILLPRWQASD